ncbi:sensor histidine kinase, partial [Clostridium butyricum]
MTKEFFYKIKDFRQKCNTNFNFLLIFIVVLGGYVCIRSSYEFVIFSISIISLGITVGFVYINTVKNKILVKKISNIKKIYFLSLIIGVVIVLVILTLLKKDSMEEVFFLLSLRATLEYSQIENIFNVENKYISNIGIHIIAIVLYVFITLINFKNISIEAIFSDLKLKEIAYISILISLCVALSTLRKILSNEFKKVILYITSIMLNLSGLIFIKLDLNIISKVLLILKCTTFTLFYGYMIDKIRYECFNIINLNIEQAIKEKKHLNSILLKRNKILNDINTM